MAPNTAPRIRRTAQNTQYTYNLPRRIHTVQTYPILSPQGATILMYGHENGITIVWRGGRRFKPQVTEEAEKGHKGKQNGQPPQDAVMIIDSDDEEEHVAAGAGGSYVDMPQFENFLDEDATYPETTQTLDLEFGTAVFHVAILPLSPCLAADAAFEGTEILKEKIVFAASCATRELFLVTLPIVPPSPLSKAREELQESLLAGKAGNGKWGETMTLLTGQEKPSDGLAMTLIRPKTASDRSKSTDRSRSASRALPHVVVASHSREASGTLRLWDVPLEFSTKPSRRTEPFQTEYLPKPLTSVSFNPTQSTQLLCNASPDAVRIYDYTIASMPPDDLSEGPFPSQGSWIISLYPPFARPSSSRKPILAASWVAHGRAVMVLLADGQWGIWDIDGVSPLGPALFGKLGSGIRGDALTEFSVGGHVEGTSPLRNPASQRASGGSADFVPMTPHSRRDAMTTTSYGPERLASVKGGIDVTPLPASATTTSDESVTLWIGGHEHVFVISGLLKFWDAQKRKGAGGGVNLFSGAQPTRMVRLSDLTVGLMGERCTGVRAIVRFAENGGQSLSGSEDLPVEVLVCGESRLVVVRESEAVVGTRIGGVIGRRKRLSERARESSAIIVHPRPEQPGSVAYNLSVGPRRKLSRPSVEGMFDQPAEESAMETEAEQTPVPLPARPRSGFAFTDNLDAAADVEQQYVEQQYEDYERDVEVEMLDIMEIDHELEALDGGREGGRKKVIFDS
ncbi:Uu.00g140460.m01.CDS01 [Anthostomella pinea]|uniref:Uu.00g140460.m01.CDS01 n=1 Tax=Anthostomella pinea TaxID=933095 RepID=A0AAI8YLI4_9PEZI|nr:Uu.00g140460.m01.CDS01 [Anthostomella pinea]